MLLIIFVPQFPPLHTVKSSSIFSVVVMIKGVHTCEVLRTVPGKLYRRNDCWLLLLKEPRWRAPGFVLTVAWFG